MNHQSGSGSGGGVEHRHIGPDLCLDLLNDLLSPEEKQRILSHLRVCPLCEKLFRERARVRDRLLAGRVLHSLQGGKLVLEKTAGSIPDRGAGKSIGDSLIGLWTRLLRSMRRPRFQLMGGLGVALVVVLMFVIRIQLRESPGIQLYPLPTRYDTTRLRAIAGAAGEDLAAGLEAYADQDLGRAINLLKKAEVGDLDNLRRVYLGSSLALEGMHSEAVEVLEAVSFDTVPEEWRYEAQWTLLVSLKRTGREARADSILRILAEKEGQVGERARRLHN